MIGQAKVFIRPIQKNLSTKPLDEVSENNTGIHEKCYQCEHFFAVCSLREHLKTCEGNTIKGVDANDSESTDHNAVGVLFNTPTVDNSYDNNNGPQPNAEQNIRTSNNTQNNLVDVLSDESLPVVSFLSQLSAETESTILIQDVIYSEEQKTHASETVVTANNGNMSTDMLRSMQLEEILKYAIRYCNENNMENPVDVFKRYIKCILVQGRPLDIEAIDSTIEGETNYVVIDRHNILESSFEEIRALTNLRLTLEVQFYEEVSKYVN